MKVKAKLIQVGVEILMSGEDNNPFENEIKPSANGYYDFTYTMDTIHPLNGPSANGYYIIQTTNVVIELAVTFSVFH